MIRVECAVAGCPIAEADVQETIEPSRLRVMIRYRIMSSHAISWHRAYEPKKNPNLFTNVPCGNPPPLGLAEAQGKSSRASTDRD